MPSLREEVSERSPHLVSFCLLHGSCGHVRDPIGMRRERYWAAPASQVNRVVEPPKTQSPVACRWIRLGYSLRCISSVEDSAEAREQKFRGRLSTNVLVRFTSSIRIDGHLIM